MDNAQIQGNAILARKVVDVLNSQLRVEEQFLKQGNAQKRQVEEAIAAKKIELTLVFNSVWKIDCQDELSKLNEALNAIELNVKKIIERISLFSKRILYLQETYIIRKN